MGVRDLHPLVQQLAFLLMLPGNPSKSVWKLFRIFRHETNSLGDYGIPVFCHPSDKIMLKATANWILSQKKSGVKNSQTIWIRPQPRIWWTRLEWFIELHPMTLLPTFFSKNMSEFRAIIGPKPFPKTMASQPTPSFFVPPWVYHWFPFINSLTNHWFP